MLILGLRDDFLFTPLHNRAMIPATAVELRQANLARALWAIHTASEDLTRARLARELSCTRATAAAVVSDLAALGLILEETAAATGRRGRPSLRLMPAEDGPVVLAVEIGVDAIGVATVAVGGVIADLAHIPLDHRDIESVLLLVRSVVRQRLQPIARRCAGVAIAMYGLVDQSSGQVASAPNLGWNDADVLSSLALPAELPVRIDNVAHLSAIAEARRGRGRGQNTVLYLHAAIGLGGALVVNGHPLYGRDGFAGEYGHLPLGREDRRCRCGSRGCWETEVDQLALVRAAGRHATPGSAQEQAARVLADAARGDPSARQGVETVSALLGRGIGLLVNVHDPDLVILGGYAADLLGAAPGVIRDSARSATMRAHRPRLPRIEPAALGPSAGLIGAADALLYQLIMSSQAMPPLLLSPAGGRHRP
jgi:predicted NBD/HSP70 family sugar kinase